MKLVQKSQTRSESPTPKFVKFAILPTPLGLWVWVIHRWNRRSYLNIRLAGHMHLSEIAFKYYELIYNYSSTTRGWSNYRAHEDPSVDRSCWHIRQNVQAETLF